MSDIQRLRRKATSELVADELRQAIMAGTFRPGDQLSESALSAQFGLGRGTVREAMQRLIQEGLVSSELHRGIYVATLDGEDILDVYFARSAAEVAATKLLTLRKDEETFGLLDTIVAEMQVHQSEADWRALADVDVKFHETIVSRTGSKRLWRMYQTLLTETRMCLNPVEQQYPRSADLVGQHRDILTAMRSGDLEKLELKVTRHLKDAVSRLADRGTADYFTFDDQDEDEAK